MNEEVKGESILRKKIQTAELFSKSQKKFKMPVFMFHWNVVEIFRDQELRTNTYTHCLSMDSAALSNKIATKNAINHYNIHQLLSLLSVYVFKILQTDITGSVLLIGPGKLDVFSLQSSQL